MSQTLRSVGPSKSAWDSALAAFPEDVRSWIDDALRGVGFLSAEVGRAVAARLRATSSDELMVRLLPLAACLADPVISHYYVGAVTRGAVDPRTGWGNLYLGANIEFAGEALAFVVHAEQAAVNHAWLRGELALSGLAVSAAPCGYCRQFLHEVTTDDRLPILIASAADSPKAQPPWFATQLGTLLPQAFGPKDLGRHGGILDGPHDARTDLELRRDTGDPLIADALNAARQSYAPYTFGHAGCALQAEDGAVYVGRYAENAAYNPSLGPMQSAMAFRQARNAGIGAEPPGITRAVLVEARGPISVRRASEAVLASVARGVALEYVEAEACSERTSKA